MLKPGWSLITQPSSFWVPFLRWQVFQRCSSFRSHNEEQNSVLWKSIVVSDKLKSEIYCRFALLLYSHMTHISTCFQITRRVSSHAWTIQLIGAEILVPKINLKLSQVSQAIACALNLSWHETLRLAHKLADIIFPQYLHQVYSFATIISSKLHICAQILMEWLLKYYKLNEVTRQLKELQQVNQSKAHADKITTTQNGKIHEDSLVIKSDIIWHPMLVYQ